MIIIFIIYWLCQTHRHTMKSICRNIAKTHNRSNNPWTRKNNMRTISRHEYIFYYVLLLLLLMIISLFLHLVIVEPQASHSARFSTLYTHSLLIAGCWLAKKNIRWMRIKIIFRSNRKCFSNIDASLAFFHHHYYHIILLDDIVSLTSSLFVAQWPSCIDAAI